MQLTDRIHLVASGAQGFGLTHPADCHAYLIDGGDEAALIDAGIGIDPDSLHARVDASGVDAGRVHRLFVTHAHADHVLGLDDLVNVRMPTEPPLVVHAAPVHRERLEAMFPQLVRPGRERIVWDDWEPGSRLELQDGALVGFETGHHEAFGTTGVLIEHRRGDAIVRIAVATDMGSPPPSSRERLRGIDRLVGDGTYLGAGGHGHPGTDAVLALAAELGIGRVAFTHIGHLGLEDRMLRDRLGPDVAVLRDGQRLGV